MTVEALKQYAGIYRSTRLDDVIPFWFRHGLDREHGSILDTDKSVWFKGRASWMFATFYSTVEQRGHLW